MQEGGRRRMMDRVAPGGGAPEPSQPQLARMCEQCDAIEGELSELRSIYDEHAGLQDRFMGAGRVTPELAAQLGLTGLAGRASGQAADLRCDHPWPPYDRMQVAIAVHRNGDVAARVGVRFDEAFESLRLIRALCAALPRGPVRADVALPARASLGAGWLAG